MCQLTIAMKLMQRNSFAALIACTSVLSQNLKKNAQSCSALLNDLKMARASVHNNHACPSFIGQFGLGGRY